MKNIFKKLPEGVKQAAFATIPLLIVIILFVTVGNFGVAKIMDLRGKITQAENDQAALTQKLNILQAVSSSLSAGSDAAVSALPASNSSLTAISQLKNLALGSGVILSAIKSGSSAGGQTGLSESQISFTVVGSRDQIIAFLTGTSGTAPIIVLDKIKMTESAGAVRADVTVRSFWAPLPKSIPSVTQPITNLTSAEKDKLTQISALAQPSFSELIAPSVSGVNPNPFGQ